MIEVVDFPKIKSPFVRENIDGRYVVTPQIEPGYEWVFEDDGVLAVDKIHGTNVCVVIEGSVVVAIHNRANVLVARPQLDTRLGGNPWRAIEGVVNNSRNLKNREGRIYGELIGPDINGNLHGLDRHMFVPFDYLKSTCHWKSWVRNEYPKTFESIREWFRGLISLYTRRITGRSSLAEGLVFHHPDGRMAKLRLDMFDWYWNKNLSTNL